MKKGSSLDIQFLMQRFALIIFIIFPITLSIIAQSHLIVTSWDIFKSIQFSLLVIIFFIPIFAFLAKKSIWISIAASKYLAILWVVGAAFVVRVIFVQLISTDFVSDMEDVHFLAVDIYQGIPLANLEKYPNIPGATHLNMSAIVLAFVYKLLGPSTATAKLFLIFLGSLTTFLVYLAGREIEDSQVGFLAAFLFAILPSVICYTGVPAGDHLALPPLVLAVFTFARTHKRDTSNFISLILHYALIGILVGLVDWFRPLGIILVLAVFISVLIYCARKWKLSRLVVILGVLLFTYSQTSNLAVRVSENFFQTNVLSASQRVGEFLLKGLNPESKGIVTLEDDAIAGQAYQSFGDDIAGAQTYLIKLAISRLEPNQIMDLFKEKFTLIWSSHDALFDYSLEGSNDQDTVNLLRDFETVQYLVITLFIFYQTITSIRQQSHPAVFAMQLFILGFALLLLVMEVQNRYVMIVIPYSILLGVMGMQAAFSGMSRSTTS